MSDLQLPKPCMAKRLHHRHIQSMITSFNACDITYAKYVRWQIDNKCKEFTLIVRAVPNILFGPNRRPNDVFTFHQIIRSKVDRIQVTGVHQKNGSSLWEWVNRTISTMCSHLSSSQHCAIKARAVVRCRSYHVNSPATQAAHPCKTTAAISPSMPVTLSRCLQLSSGP